MESKRPAKGWCPGLYKPMPVEDGLLIRLTPPSPEITMTQLAVMLQAAERYGNGVIQLTSLGNLQLRGFTAASLPPFRKTMIDACLSEPTSARERARRAVLASPLRGLDPDCATLTPALTEALVDELAQSTMWTGIPVKFRIVLNGGGALPGSALPGDVLIDHVAGRWRVARGPGSGTSRVSTEMFRRIVHVAMELGLEPIDDTGSAWQEVKTLPQYGSVGPVCGPWFAYGVPFGILTPDLLATMIVRGRVIRPLHQRMILAEAGLDHDALITHRNSPMLRVFACRGQASCACASTNTLNDARICASRLPPGRTLHVSGCEKACAHPHKADITLIGRDGSYDLVRDGTARDMPVERGLTPATACQRIAALPWKTVTT